MPNQTKQPSTMDKQKQLAKRRRMTQNSASSHGQRATGQQIPLPRRKRRGTMAKVLGAMAATGGGVGVGTWISNLLT